MSKDDRRDKMGPDPGNTQADWIYEDRSEYNSAYVFSAYCKIL